MTIPLTKGFVAIVDACDEWVGQFKWHAKVDARRGLVYAGRTTGPHHERIRIYLHRLLTGAKPGELVDHKDRNGLNNRRSNLRICTRAQNAQNSKKPRTNSSGLKGVSWRKDCRKWEAQIRAGTRRINLGHFHSPQEAHAAYRKASRELHGAFGRTA